MPLFMILSQTLSVQVENYDVADLNDNKYHFCIKEQH